MKFDNYIFADDNYTVYKEKVLIGKVLPVVKTKKVFL